MDGRHCMAWDVIHARRGTKPDMKKTVPRDRLRLNSRELQLLYSHLLLEYYLVVQPSIPTV